MSFTPEQQDILKEIIGSERITLYCADHMYTGPVKSHPEVKPSKNCPKCWQVYFIHDLASVPPGMREQRLAELEEVLYKMHEMVLAGTWDFNPYEHAKLEFSEE